MECWGRKREGRRLFAAARRERGYFWEELDDFILSADGLWVLGALAAIVVGVIVVVLR